MAQISIIIPVYNSESYLTACIQSILGQSFKDFEILAVDDGSRDRSLWILRQFALLDRRLKVYSHAVNKGAPAARNLGLTKAAGKYIMFVDADDELANGSLRHLIECAAAYGSDCVKGTLAYRLKRYRFTWKNKTRVYPSERLPNQSFGDCRMVWHLREYQTYLIKSELISRNGGRFDETLFACQDIPFLTQVLCSAQSITIIPHTVYFHRNHRASIVNKKWGLHEYQSLLRGYYMTTECLMANGYRQVARFFCQTLVDYSAKFVQMPKLLTPNECISILEMIKELHAASKLPLWNKGSHPWEKSFFRSVALGSNDQALAILRTQGTRAKNLKRLLQNVGQRFQRLSKSWPEI